MSIASIVKKAIMAVSGLALVGFLVSHLTGNLLLLKGQEAFNAYADGLHALGGGYLLPIAEIGLASLFLIHIVSGVRVSLENRQAREVDYHKRKTKGGSTLASRTMIVGGILLALFLVIHVRMFRFGALHPEAGLFGLVILSFQDPILVTFYVLAMLALGLHLSHGIGSGFQSLGLLKPQWRPRLRRAGQVIGWAIALGFAALPLWAFLIGHSEQGLKAFNL